MSIKMTIGEIRSLVRSEVVSLLEAAIPIPDIPGFTLEPFGESIQNVWFLHRDGESEEIGKLAKMKKGLWVSSPVNLTRGEYKVFLSPKDAADYLDALDQGFDQFIAQEATDDVVDMGINDSQDDELLELLRSLGYPTHPGFIVQVRDNLDSL